MNVKNPKEILGKLFKGLGIESGVHRGQVMAAWGEIAGANIAYLTRPLFFRDAVLVIQVPDSVLAHELTYRRQDLLDKYQLRYPNVVKEIVFRHGNYDYQKPNPAEPTKVLPTLTPEEDLEVADIVAKAPPELKGVVLKTSKLLKQSRKVATHPPCVVCGVPTPQRICVHCKRLLEHPVVQAEALRLRRKPLKPRLEGDLKDAALYLARMHLEAEMNALLPAAVQNSELVALLGDVATRYLQLLSGQKDVSRLLNNLPVSISSLLKEI